MLDLAVEYKEYSKMGYAELAAVSAHTAPGLWAHVATRHSAPRFFTQVFEPYLVPGPGMQLFQAKHWCQKSFANTPARPFVQAQNTF